MRPQVLDPRDRGVGQGVGDVEALGVLGHRVDGVVPHQLVRVEEGVQALEGAVVVVEAALQRPRRPVGVRAEPGVLREVPLADRVRGVAGRAQDLRQGEHVVGEAQSQIGESRVGIRDRAVAGAVRVEAGEQRRPGGRTHRSRVVIGRHDAARSERVEVRRRNLGTVRTDVREAHVVDQDDDDVRGIGPGTGLDGPGRFRLGLGAADPPGETLVPAGVIGDAHAVAITAASCSTPSASSSRLRSCAKPGSPGRRPSPSPRVRSTDRIP